MMIEDYSWFITGVILNALALIQVYFSARSFGGHEFDLTRKGIIKNVTLALGNGLAMASLIEFSNNSFIVHFILNFSVFLWVIYFVKRNIFDSIIIFTMVFLKMVIIQMIVLFFLQQVGLDERMFLLIAQVFTVSIAVLIALKIKLYNLFLFIQQRIYLKVSIYLLVAIILIVLAFTDFDTDNAWEPRVLLGILIIIALLGIIVTTATAQEQIDKSIKKYHDVVNMFMGLYLSIESGDEEEVVKRLSREIKEYLTDRPSAKAMVGDYGQSLKVLLQDKLAVKGKSNELILDINYHEHHKKVSLSKVTSMLGTLFDNALEHGLNEPILVDLNISEYTFELTVKNSCQELSDKQLKKMFKQGYSTKEKTGHGHGLYKLEQDVKKYKDEYFISETIVDTYYDMTYESDYLEIIINISPKHIKRMPG